MDVPYVVEIGSEVGFGMMGLDRSINNVEFTSLFLFLSHLAEDLRPHLFCFRGRRRRRWRALRRGREVEGEQQIRAHLLEPVDVYGSWGLWGIVCICVPHILTLPSIHACPHTPETFYAPDVGEVDPYGEQGGVGRTELGHGLHTHQALLGVRPVCVCECCRLVVG